MSFLHAIEPAYVLSGFLVGALVGITGVGGGALMTPILIFFGIPPVAAVGTDLLYASLTKTGGTLVHGYNKTVDWKIVGRLASGSIPAAAVTIAVLYEMNIHGAAIQALITKVLGAALLLTALSLFFRKAVTRLYFRHIGELPTELCDRLTVAAGVLLGVLVSISSVGAGAIGVTMLIMLYPRMPIARIVGSDIAHAVPLTLAAGLGHWMLGSINWMLLITLLLGSLPGIFIGSVLSTRLPDRVVRLSLATVLLVVCGKLLLA